MTTGNWYVITFIFDDARNATELWTNGVRCGTNAFAGAITPSNGYATILGNNGAGLAWLGEVDELFILNRALTGDDQTNLWNTWKTRP